MSLTCRSLPVEGATAKYSVTSTAAAINGVRFNLVLIGHHPSR